MQEKEKIKYYRGTWGGEDKSIRVLCRIFLMEDFFYRRGATTVHVSPLVMAIYEKLTPLQPSATCCLFKLLLQAYALAACVVHVSPMGGAILAPCHQTRHCQWRYPLHAGHVSVSRQHQWRHVHVSSSLASGNGG